jgi:putative NADH-flavin reductase
MKIAVFGASGRTGRCILEQTQSLGYAVKAFLRNPAAIPTKPPPLAVVQGNALDPAAVERAVAGQDAVLSALGIKPWTREPVLLEGTRNILAAMEKHGVRRFICESSFGVGDSKDDADWFTNSMIGLCMGRLFEQKARQEELIRQSNFEWVIVRPARLTNGPRTGTYRVGEHLRPGLFGSISRADVAEFMLKQLTDDTWLRKTVTIGG